MNIDWQFKYFDSENIFFCFSQLLHKFFSNTYALKIKILSGWKQILYTYFTIFTASSAIFASKNTLQSMFFAWAEIWSAARFTFASNKLKEVIRCTGAWTHYWGIHSLIKVPTPGSWIWWKLLQSFPNQALEVNPQCVLDSSTFSRRQLTRINYSTSRHILIFCKPK